MSITINNNQYFKEIFNNAKVGILVLDQNGVLIDVNIEALNIFGYKYKNLNGQNLTVLLSKKHSSKDIIDMLNKNILTGEYTGKKNNSVEFPIYISASKINNYNRLTLIVNDISNIKDKEKQLKYHAYFDDLTKLPNRNLFFDRSEVALSQAKRSNESFAVMFIDLDGFKKINDSLGHDAGDQILIYFSKNLLASARSTDTVARIGGDEFIVLMPRISSINDAIELSKRIIESNRVKIKINNNSISPKSSIGISVYPEDGGTIAKLIKSADKAMYTAKRSGENLFYHHSIKK